MAGNNKFTGVRRCMVMRGRNHQNKMPKQHPRQVGWWYARTATWAGERSKKCANVQSPLVLYRDIWFRIRKRRRRRLRWIDHHRELKEGHKKKFSYRVLAIRAK